MYIIKYQTMRSGMLYNFEWHFDLITISIYKLPIITGFKLRFTDHLYMYVLLGSKEEPNATDPTSKGSPYTKWSLFKIRC